MKYSDVKAGDWEFIGIKEKQMKIYEKSKMIKKLTIVLLLAFALTGCSTKKEIRYLTHEEAQQYPAVMIANGDIRCTTFTINKGTIFIVKEIGGSEYKIAGNGLFEDMYSMVTGTNEHIFPADALFIKLQEDYKAGFIVYPNGKFVYDNYSFFGQDDFGKMTTWDTVECTCNGEYPFKLQDNR